MFFACRVCDAQNLVPNGDFEQYTICPSATGMLSKATFWYNPALLTPDYFDTCSIGAHVPDNGAGYQFAHSGGGYAGIFASEVQSVPDAREYMRAQLIQPLQAGSDYAVQFYVSLGDISGNCIGAMGAWLTVADTAPMNLYLMTGAPQIVNTIVNPLCDTAGWVLISGTFTASGNENYITIGNFFDDNNCGLQNNGPGTWVAAYYYVDDVSVTLATGIKDENKNTAISIYPVPFNEMLHISNIENELSEIILYDIASRKLLQQTFTNSVTLNTAHLAKGMYLYEVRNKGGVVKKGKVVKE
jgi:hypothetical protein